MAIHHVHDLIVWQRGLELVTATYGLTSEFPKSEIYGLTSQIRRAAVSIPANIAEGRRRGTRRDFRQFLRIAYASGSELETHLEIAKRLDFGKQTHRNDCFRLLQEVQRMLNSMLTKLTPNL